MYNMLSNLIMKLKRCLFNSKIIEKIVFSAYKYIYNNVIFHNKIS